MPDLKKKILDVLIQRRVATFATMTEDGKPWVRYVVATPDEQLRLTIPTHRKSRKIAQIRRNPEVHVTTGVTNLETARHYVQVQGTAEVVDDEATRKAHWRPFLAPYFEGPDDPDFVLVVVKPYRIEYVSMDLWSPEVWVPA